jgi:hypothetical protein
MAKKKFKPHMMYIKDKQMADTYEEHVKLGKKGYGHTPFDSLLKQTSPLLKKLSAGCKAAARRKFKVYPSAYANMWASKQQKKGKC